MVLVFKFVIYDTDNEAPGVRLKIVEYHEFSAWKLSKYKIISGPYFPLFGLNTEKYGPEVTSYFDTFYAVK